MKQTLLLIWGLCMFLALRAQDTTLTSTPDIEVKEVNVLAHSPRKATIMSAVLPGLGQAYNRKYWKIPILYAGLGTCVFFIRDNNQNFQLYKDAYIAELDDDPTTINTTPYNSSQLNELQETYRRWRDISYMSLAAVYVLNLIDANVDAHLFYFDVDEDLSFQVLPYALPSAGVNAGLSFVVNF